MDTLPNNSDKALSSKAPEKRAEKVIKGNVKHRQTLKKMIRDSFVPEDVENAGSYILSDMVVPGFRDGVFDILMGILEYWRGGVSGGRRRARGGSQGIISSRYDYTTRIGGNRVNTGNRGPQESSSTPAQRYSYDDLILPTISEAEEVIASLKDIIRAYQVARVADLFDLVGITGAYTDYNYGWTNLDRASYQRVSGGWLLILPKAMPIEN